MRVYVCLCVNLVPLGLQFCFFNLQKNKCTCTAGSGNDLLTHTTNGVRQCCHYVNLESYQQLRIPVNDDRLELNTEIVLDPHVVARQEHGKVQNIVRHPMCCC